MVDEGSAVFGVVEAVSLLGCGIGAPIMGWVCSGVTCLGPDQWVDVENQDRSTKRRAYLNVRLSLNYHRLTTQQTNRLTRYKRERTGPIKRSD